MAAAAVEEALAVDLISVDVITAVVDDEAERGGLLSSQTQPIKTSRDSALSLAAAAAAVAATSAAWMIL